MNLTLFERPSLSNKVRFTGYVSPQDFPYYLAASDVCLNLRFPTAGETSASLLRIMGAGVPVLVSRTGSFEELPDDAAGKIDVDDAEEELLLEHLLLLAHRPDLGEAMSRNARAYAARHHTLEQAAHGYLQFLASLAHHAHARQIELDIALQPDQAMFSHAVPETPPYLNSDSQVPNAEPKIRDTKSKIQNPLALIAEAAAELGITEKDEAVLAHISTALHTALHGLIPPEQGV